VCTSSGTWSQWLGTSTSPKPQIYCLDARDYLGNYLDAYLISIVVSMDAVRIKSLGAVVRRVSEQNIFSYTWAKGTRTRSKPSDARLSSVALVLLNSLCCWYLAVIIDRTG
jgi:hypothetical protein